MKFIRRLVHTFQKLIFNFEEAAFMRFTLEKEILKLSCQTFSRKSLNELKRNVEQQEELMSENENVQEFHKLDKQFHYLILKRIRRNTFGKRLCV